METKDAKACLSEYLAATKAEEQARSDRTSAARKLHEYLHNGGAFPEGMTLATFEQIKKDAAKTSGPKDAVPKESPKPPAVKVKVA